MALTEAQLQRIQKAAAENAVKIKAGEFTNQAVRQKDEASRNRATSQNAAGNKQTPKVFGSVFNNTQQGTSLAEKFQTPNYENMELSVLSHAADEAEQAYQNYLKSDERKAKEQEATDRVSFWQNAGVSGDFLGLFSYVEDTENGKQLKEKAEYLRGLADQKKQAEIETNAEALAEQAEKEYQDYIHSEDYVAWKLAQEQQRSDRLTMMSSAGVSGEYLGLFDWIDEDEKEKELKSRAEYYRGIAAQKQEQEMMLADVTELQSWPAEDQELLYEYVTNRAGGARTILGQNFASFLTSESAANKLFEKYGEDRVKEIAESYSRYENQKASEQVSTLAQEGAGGSVLGAVGHSVGSVGANLLGAVTSPMGYLGELVGGGKTGRYATIDANNIGNLPNTYSGAVRSEVSGNIEEAGGSFGSVGSTLYQAGMSALDNLTRVIAAGDVGSLALAATGSFGQSVSKYSHQGATPTEAVLLGIVDGGLEVLTEKVSLDNLLKEVGDSKDAIEIVKQMLIQGGVEVSEEEASFIGSILAEAAILRNKSSYNQKINELVSLGRTQEEAKKEAGKELVMEAAETAVQSFLSGGMMSGATSVYSNTMNRMQEKAAENQLKKTVNQAAASVQQGTQQQEGTAKVTAQPGTNVGTEVMQQAQRLSAATGREVVFYSAPATSAGIENGYYQDGKIYVNSQSQNPLAQIISHELTHSVEMADAYKELSALVKRRIEQTGGNLEQLRQEKREMYSRNGVTFQSESDIDSEIVAAYVEQYLLTDEQSIIQLTTESPSLGQRILNWLDRVLAKLGNTNAQERTFLTQARNAYAKALGQTQTSFTAQTGVNVGNSNSRSDNSKLDSGNGTLDTDNAGMSLEQMKEWARDEYRTGRISEEEFDSLMDSITEYEEQNGIDGMAAEDRRFSNDESSGKKHSFAGVNAKNADMDALQRAKEMEAQGVANETIRQETGWFQGRDGKWRFEIDDSKMRYIRRGDLGLRERRPEYARYQELLKKSDRYVLELSDEALTLEETAELQKLENIWGGTFRTAGRITEDALPADLLSDYVKHDDLFEAYPQLRKTRLRFVDLPEGTRGQYDPEQDVITLSESLRRKPQDTLIHEIQHVIQKAEGFSRGSSMEYWMTKLAADRQREVELADKKYREIFDSMPEELKRKVRAYNRANLDYDYDEAIAIENELLESEYGELFSAWQDADFERRNLRERYEAADLTEDAITNYWNTAGEIEARDAASRRSMSEEERKKLPPNLGDEDTVFAESSGISLDQAITDYPYNMQTVIRDYMDAVDDDVLAFVEEVQNGTAWKGKKVTVGTVNSRMAKDIASLTGTENVEGSNIILNTNAAQHIEKRHGKNGEHDRTMRNNQDIARINYILQNYDSMELSNRKNFEYKNRDGSASQNVIVSKKINGTYFVIEAAPNTGKVGIVSAYMDKNGASQVSDENTPDLNARNELASTPINSLPNGGSNVKRQLSISEQIVHKQDGINEQDETDSERAWKTSDTTEDVRGTLPAKARSHLEGTERTLLNKIGKALGVPYHAKRDSLKPMIQELSNEYLRTGTISSETVNSLFEKSYEEGIVVDREFYDQYKEIKDHLRKTAVTISEQDRADIADFQDFRNRAFGTLRITNDGGLPVDSAYHELNGMAPELFPESITHPADQLQRMFEVGQSIRVSEMSLDAYYGKDSDFKRWAKNDFATAVDDIMGELRQVKRYSDEKNAESDSPIILTADEAAEAWKQLKDARKTYEKVNAKNLLTSHDEMQVGRLLRGEVQLEHLQNEENYKSIKAVFEAKQEYERINNQLKEYKKQVRSERLKQAEAYLETANEWKDKRTGIAYSRETMRRNILDIVPDAKVAERVLREYFEPVQIQEAKSTRFKTEYRNRVRELNLSQKVAKGNLVSEAHAVQLLGEAADNIRMLEKARGRTKMRDGKNLSEWQAVVDNLWAENPNLDRAKIERSVQEFRNIYDDLFQQMNKVRVENGYEPVNYRQGYFPHFQPGDGDGIMAYFGKALGIDTNVEALPTTINGLTHTFKPGIQWFGNAQERLGFNTAYDAVEGFDKYIEGVSSVIHHTENIQKLRALATQARYRTSEEGLRLQVDEVQRDTRLTEEEKQMKIRDIYEHGKYTLSNFVAELDEYTNLLANKKSKYDRTMEAMLGRKAYTIMKKAESRVGANMVAGNLSSAVTNFIPLTQAWGRIGTADLLKGMRDTAKAVIHKDGSIVGQSDFLTSRRGSDVLVQGWNEKLSNVLGAPMEIIDNVVSESIVRGAYYQNLRRGLSEYEAMHQADLLAASVMADRSKGSMPTLFESSNPIFKAFTQFQLEVNNQYSEIFKDVPREYRDKSKWMLAVGFFKYFIAAFLFNELEEKVKGRRSALDPLGIVTDFAEDWKNAGFGEAGANFAVNIAESLPFASALSMVGVDIDGGRIPVSSAMMDFSALWDAATDPDMSSAERWDTVGDELQKPLTYLVLPGGGNQISKIWKGIDAYRKGGSYSLDQDGNEVLQYPVYKDDGGDAFWNLVRSMVFGKNSLQTAQNWVNNGFDSLNAYQTAVYQDMLEAGTTDRDAYKLVDALRNVEQPEGEDGAELKRREQQQILLDSDVPVEGKAIAFYGMIAKDSEQELMNILADAGAEPGEIYRFVIDFDDAKNLSGTERKEALYDVITQSSLTDEEKKAAIGEILGTELETDSGNPSQYAKFLSALEEGMTADQYMELYSKNVKVDDYLELVDAGIRSDSATELAIALAELEPENGEDSVTWKQQCEAILKSSLSDAEQVAALEMVSYESTAKKIRIGYENGLEPYMFINLKNILQNYDANGNGSYSQAEVTEAVNAMAGSELYLAATGGTPYLTNTQKAILWQLQTGAKDGKSNPYDTEVGKYIYDLVQAGKESDS